MAVVSRAKEVGWMRQNGGKPNPMGAPEVVKDVARAARHEADEYRHGKDRPLAQYATIMGANASILGGIVVAFRRSGRRMPRGVATGDILVTAVAVHRWARLLAKDAVTSPLRAPFTRFDGPAAPAELKEDVRGSGWRKALGELVTCPFCLGHWVATGFAVGWLFAPRATRFFASMTTALALADAMQFGYAKLEQL
ncbi:MAG: DUF1360 domain-containing protein [Actinomycetota bacterium]